MMADSWLAVYLFLLLFGYSCEDVTNCPESAFVDIDVRSRGCDDPGKPPRRCGVTFIKVHGKNYAPRRKGHNVVIVDAKTGAVTESKRFDTHGNNLAGSNLRDYLDDINGDKIVLVAIQDDGSKYVSPALDALKGLGATDPILVAFRGSFALAGFAQPDKPYWVTQEQHMRYKGPSRIILRIPLKQSRQPRTVQLVANWLLDSYDKDVILRNGASYKSQNGTTALYLNGNGTYVDVPAINLYEFSAFTMMCWVKVLEPAKNPGYIFADWSSPHQFSIWVHGEKKAVYFQLRNKIGQNLMSLYTGGVTYGIWMHVTVTWDQNKRLATIFFDGKEKGSKVADTALSSYEIMNNSHSFYQIGSKNDSGETFYGLIRNLKVFKKVLSDREILTELYGVNEYYASCLTNPIGVSDPKIIPDSQMTASSTYEEADEYQPGFGRLQGDRGDGWCSRTKDSDDDWLQVYFGEMFTVCGVDTQGDRNGNEWTTAFKLSFSTDGSSWITYAYENGTDVEFRREGDSTTVDKHKLPEPVQARYIRFHPTDRHVWNCLRVEVYGKEAYHFNAWLIITNQYLTLELLNATTEQYKTMKANVMTKFNSIVDGSVGFFLAEFQRFGAQSINISSDKALPMVEIKVFCISASVKGQLMAIIRTGIKTIPMFHSNYLEELDTVNCTCPPATVDINLSKTLEEAKVYYTTDMMVFKAKVQHSRCSSSVETFSYWHITKATLKGRKFDSFLPGGIKHDKPVWSMRRRKSFDSYYYVSYVVRTLSQLRIMGHDYGYILLLQSSPVANISGAYFGFKGQGNITLNGSRSYDPHPEKGSPLTFTWFCRRSYETFHENDSLAVDTPNGNANLSGGCYGYGPGRLSGRENVLNVDVDKMDGGQTYVFELLVSNGVESSRASHQLAVASFVISCIYNCGPEVIPKKQMIIESNCAGDICGTIARHDWSLFKRDDSSLSWVQISDLAERILTDLDNPSIVLTGKLGGNEHSLEMNTTYKIKASIIIEGGLVLEDDLTFRTVKPLSFPKKRCSVKPKKGFVLKTNFSVECSGWYDENKNLTYNLSYATSTGIVSAGGRHSPYIAATLPQGNKSEDYNITIRVDIFDQNGASQADILTVKVEPLPQNDPSLLPATLTSDITNFLKEGKVSEAASHAIAALSADVDDKSTYVSIELYSRSVSDGKSSQPSIALSHYLSLQAKDSTLQAIAGAPITLESQVTQFTAIVIMATEGRARMPVDTLEDATSLLRETTNFLRNHYNRDLIQTVGEDILRGISHTLNASTGLADEQDLSQSIQLEGRTDLGRLRRGNRRSREAEDVHRDFDNVKKITENILSVADTLGSTVLSTKMTGQKKTSLKSDVLTMTIQRQAPSDIGSETFTGNEDEGSVTFPSTEVLFGRNGTTLPSVDTQMLTLQVNPYVWTNSSKTVKSSVVRLELKKADGSQLNISDLSHPIELFIPEKKQKEDTTNYTQDHLFVKRPSNDSSSLRYHKIEIENEFESAFVKIRPQNHYFFDVFVRRSVRPTPSNYTLRTRIPDFSSCRTYDDRTGSFNCTENPYVFSLSSNVTGDIGVHFIGIRIASDKGKKSTRNKRSGKMKSCKDRHGRQKRSCVGVKDPPTNPPPTPEIVMPQYDQQTDVNYTMSVTMRSCLYWSETKNVWTSEGCKVGWKHTDGQLHCLCTHLSAFGGNIFVAPNPIDFDKVWTEFKRLGETGNFVVLSTVCFLLGLYVIGLVVARRADKKDLRKVVANVYLTTSQTEGFTYQLSIHTGAWKGFGTSACVGIIIYGENGHSEAITLTDPLARRKLFTRASVNIFTLTLPSSLGKLTNIRIWHDNTGSNPAWFLQRVVITDQQTEDVWYFFANQWLSLDKRGGSIDLKIKAAGEDELAAFKPLFYARTSRSLGEGHIWISVFTRPPHNPFTRCQRLTCCLCFLFTALVTNAMFYQFDETPTDTFKFGPLVMSWTQIKIGIQSSVIAIPANLLVVLIFRNTKQGTTEEIYDPRQNAEKPKTPGCLPPVFVYVAWCLSLLMSLTGAAFTVFYSLMWGADISNKWLTSILVSLFQDILITQPIKVLALATLLSLLIKKPPEEDPIIGTSLFKSEKGERVAARRKQIKELAHEKEASSKKWDMTQTVQEVVSFLIFGFLLMIVSYTNLDNARFQFTKSTGDLFGGFEEVVDTPSLWSWMDEVLVPGLYDVTWYNGQPFEYNEGFISNKKNFLVGMPRLRQIRLKKRKSCPTTLYGELVDELFPAGCLEAYSSDVEERTPLNLRKWIPLGNYSDYDPISDICPKPWRYQSGTALNTLSHAAVINSYDGGGYVADLGYNKESALKVISDLRDYGWVDTLTAAVFIEFTLFDPSTSLFCSVRLIYERLPTGKAVTDVDVRALTLYPSTDAHLQSFYEVCEILFLVAIVVCFIVEVVKFFRQKKYFHQTWNVVELILLVVSLLAVVMSFLKGKYTSLYVKNVKSNPYGTFSSDNIVRWLDRETLWFSLAIFIITLKLLRLIRFNHHICQMQGTMKRSAWPIMSFSLVFIIAVIAFTHFGFLCFGSNLALFSSFFESLRVVLTLSVGKQIDYLEVYLNNQLVGSLYLFLFLIIMIFILINLFIAILVDAYGEVREEQGDNFRDAELGKFMYNVVRKATRELPSKMMLASKLLLKKVPRKASRDNIRRDVKYSGEADSFIDSRVDESEDGTGTQLLKPADDIKISLASPTFRFQNLPEYANDGNSGNVASDIKDILREEDLLADIKTRFIDIADELATITCYMNLTTERDRETAI